MVVKYTTIFFERKAQATVEYFVLLVIFALLTIIGASVFFPAVKDAFLNKPLPGSDKSFFAEAVYRILQ